LLVPWFLFPVMQHTAYVSDPSVAQLLMPVDSWHVVCRVPTCGCWVLCSARPLFPLSVHYAKERSTVTMTVLLAFAGVGPVFPGGQAVPGVDAQEGGRGGGRHRYASNRPSMVLAVSLDGVC
jgi:hypothetical protein